MHHTAAAALTMEHDHSLVTLAVCLCIFGVMTAIRVLQLSMASHGSRRMAWLGTAAIVSGCSIWSAHFVAMLAYNSDVVDRLRLRADFRLVPDRRFRLHRGVRGHAEEGRDLALCRRYPVRCRRRADALYRHGCGRYFRPAGLGSGPRSSVRSIRYGVRHARACRLARPAVRSRSPGRVGRACRRGSARALHRHERAHRRARSVGQRAARTNSRDRSCRRGHRLDLLCTDSCTCVRRVRPPRGQRPGRERPPDPLHGISRSADRPAEPRLSRRHVRRTVAEGTSRRQSRLRCWPWISIASNRSTTFSAIRPATVCCAPCRP